MASGGKSSSLAFLRKVPAVVSRPLARLRAWTEPIWRPLDWALGPGLALLIVLIGRWTCRLLSMVHVGVSHGLRGLGWALGHVLSVVPWPVRLAVLSAGLGVFALLLWRYGQGWILETANLFPEQLEFLIAQGSIASLQRLTAASAVAGCLLLAAAAAAFVPARWALVALKIAAAAFVAVWGYMLVWIIQMPGTLFRMDPKTLQGQRNELWIGGVWAWVPIALVAVLLVVCLLCRAVAEYYSRAPAEKSLLGDLIFDSIRTGGRDPRFRTSVYYVTFSFLAVLFLPSLLRGCGMEDPYDIPLGSGVEVVKVIKVQKKKQKKRRLILNMNSPIIFHTPKIEESLIFEEVSRLTEEQYQAVGTEGKPGKGKGKAGGWPDGVANARVRFIRLKYSGGDWDQDMGYGSDYNLLLEFKKVTGFNIARNTEAIDIYRLKRFPRGKGPPFVYLTGKGNIHTSGSDLKTLRWYCLEEGGLIFADNGGGHFDRSFRSLLRRVFPDLPIVDIANDDIIYQQPYLFPSGAPPLWHHSGKRAMGVKDKTGRWVVFYHQGDIGDAWKTGHSGASSAVASRAYKLGINVMYYSFTRYLARHHAK